MRGNRLSFVAQPLLVRSIPAGAGEPGDFNVLWAECQVYPRGCGGTGEVAMWTLSWEGLSPRVRGNPMESNQRHERQRSIPAGAGEPSLHSLGSGRIPVYPRGCGGTSQILDFGHLGRGLSPRVRGNPRDRTPDLYRRRSIPAGAGESSTVAKAIHSVKVYPRRCGGTNMQESPAYFGRGLSPRVRGNLVDGKVNGCGRGSIPAGAGEPPPTSRNASPYWVYPRGCGGTS